MASPSPEASSSTPTTLRLPAISSQSQACNLLTSAIQHLFFAKGQVHEPIAVLQTKRARERIAEKTQRRNSSVESTMGANRRKDMNFAKRRKLRKVDELLVGFQQLCQNFTNAIHQLSSEYPNLSHLNILLRFGQSRLSSRQQIIISLHDVLSLPPQEPALQDTKLRRQRLSGLERKLVRFLLGVSNEDDSFARVINSPLILTKAHIFLLAPSSFACRGWSIQRSLRVPIALDDRSAVQDVQVPSSSDFLKPVKHSLTSPNLSDRSTTKKERVEQSVSHSGQTADLDVRRMQRLQLRAEQRAAAKVQANGREKDEKGAVSRRTKKEPLSAIITLKCTREEEIDDDIPPRSDMQWFACKVVLKGIV